MTPGWVIFSTQTNRNLSLLGLSSMKEVYGNILVKKCSTKCESNFKLNDLHSPTNGKSAKIILIWVI